MNNNHLTKLTAFQIETIMDYDDIKLKEIGLKWNHIDGEGGCAIAEGLIKNKYLKILDLSWNKIGVKRAKMKKG